MNMRHLILTLLSCSLLTGCIGTKVTGRQTDTNQPHPDLHSVPDKPTPIDTKQIQQEMNAFDQSHEDTLEQNQRLRKNNPAPEKP